MKKIVVIGSLNMDFVINVEKMPIVGETILADKYSLVSGGKGANQAYTVGKLGGEIIMLGAVGDDSNAKILLESLESAGVCTNHIKKMTDTNTGIAMITVNSDGDNSIIVIQGANKCVDIAYIDEKMSIINDADIVIFQLEIPLDTVVYAAKKAKAMGKTIILDPAPAQKNLPKELLECVDILKPNETELAILLDNEVLSLSDATKKVQSYGVKNVLVTLGKDGAFLRNEQGQEFKFDVDNVKVVDTTAAGDSFTGAVATSLAKGDSLISAIEFANKVSALVVSKKGAQSSIPSIKEVRAYYKK